MGAKAVVHPPLLPSRVPPPLPSLSEGGRGDPGFGLHYEARSICLWSLKLCL